VLVPEFHFLPVEAQLLCTLGVFSRLGERSGTGNAVLASDENGPGGVSSAPVAALPVPEFPEFRFVGSFAAIPFAPKEPIDRKGFNCESK